MRARNILWSLHRRPRPCMAVASSGTQGRAGSEERKRRGTSRTRVRVMGPRPRPGPRSRQRLVRGIAQGLRPRPCADLFGGKRACVKGVFPSAAPELAQPVAHRAARARSLRLSRHRKRSPRPCTVVMSWSVSVVVVVVSFDVRCRLCVPFQEGPGCIMWTVSLRRSPSACRCKPRRPLVPRN